MLRTIFYGLTHGIATGRKLADSCRYDIRMRTLSGELRPDCRTFHRFIIRHRAEIDALFVQIVRLAQKMGLVKLGRVAIDGSRFKAKTSKHKAMSYGRMEEAIQTIRQELETLKDDLAKTNSGEAAANEMSIPKVMHRREDRLKKIESAKKALEADAVAEGKNRPDDRAQKSFHDHDALPMAGKGESFIYGYNAQAAVDEAHQIVVAAILHDNAADSSALPAVVSELTNNCRGGPAAVLADAGYNSVDNIRTVELQGSVPLIAAGKGENATVQRVAEQLVPTQTPGSYRCIAGKTLVGRVKKDGRVTLPVPGSLCHSCPFSDFCSVYPKRGKTITLRRIEDHELMRAHLARMRSDEAGEAYRRRKVIVEPVFGNIKNKGMRIVVRGFTQVKTWWTMACMAHNIEKLVGAMGS